MHFSSLHQFSTIQSRNSLPKSWGQSKNCSLGSHLSFSSATSTYQDIKNKMVYANAPYRIHYKVRRLSFDKNGHQHIHHVQCLCKKMIATNTTPSISFMYVIKHSPRQTHKLMQFATRVICFCMLDGSRGRNWFSDVTWV